jgi:hypothetical protein
MKAKQILTTVATAIAMSLIGNVAQAQAECPKAGELKNFAQMTAQSEIFNGCDVTTEVSFILTGTKGSALSAYDLNGQTLIIVMPLGQQSSCNPLGGLDAFLATIPNDKADPVFTLKTGDTLRLRGFIDRGRDRLETDVHS